MRRIKPNIRTEIKEETLAALSSLLRYHVSYGTIDYLRRKQLEDFRAWERRQHEGYPISACGIRASRHLLRAQDDLLVPNQKLAPEATTEYLQDFPLDQASAAYCFTVLELYGDTLVELVNPKALKKRMSWHRSVSDHISVDDGRALVRARRYLAETFNIMPARVPVEAIVKLVELKAVRNKIAHAGSAPLQFESFFKSIVRLICQLHFMMLPRGEDIVVFPFEDDGQWADRWPLFSWHE